MKEETSELLRQAIDKIESEKKPVPEWMFQALVLAAFGTLHEALDKL